MNYFKIACIITSALFAYLFFLLLFNSGSFLSNIGLQPGIATAVLARRTSVFMLAVSFLLLCSMNLQHSNARQYICLFMAIILIGLAFMGTYELMNKTVTMAIMQPIIIETILGGSFLIIFFVNRKTHIQ